MTTRGKVIAALSAVSASVLLLLFSGLYLDGERRYYEGRRAEVEELALRTSLLSSLVEVYGRPGVEAAALAGASEARVREIDAALSGLKASMEGAEGSALLPGIEREWVEVKKGRSRAPGTAPEGRWAARDLEGLERMGSSIEELSALIEGRLGELASLRKKALVASSLFSAASLCLAGLLVSLRVFRPLSIIRQSLDSMAGLVPGLEDEAGWDDEPGVILARLKRLNLSCTELLNRCHDVIGASPVATFELDERCKIRYLNSAAEALLGYSKADLLDRPLKDLVDEKNRRDLAGLFADLSGSGSRAGLALALSGKDGRTSRVELTAISIRDQSGFGGAVVFAKDLEETARIAGELKAVRREAEMTSRALKDNIRDLEDFALMAVRRELKMKEIREMLKKFSEEQESKKGYRH